MKVFESIRIEGAPFPRPLPVPLECLQRACSEHGFAFEGMGNNRTASLIDVYVPDRLGRIQEIVELKKWNVKVVRSVWPEFDECDYKAAPLCQVHFPDLWIDGIDCASICDECGRKRILVDPEVRVSEVNSDSPFHSVNGQFAIVSAAAMSALSDTLVGAQFYPFDSQGRYFILNATRDLGPLQVRDDEVIGYTGACTQCGRPRFTTYIGPLRFPKTQWSGEDVVHEAFYDGCLFTHRAFELMREFDGRLTRGSIALLD